MSIINWPTNDDIKKTWVVSKHFSPRFYDFRTRLLSFMKKELYPAEAIYLHQHNTSTNKWETPPIMEQLKQKAKDAGLWNLFLPKDSSNKGANLTNLEYAPLCEIMGSSPLAPEVFNCSAPDTGNMETIARYGSPELKAKFLQPLLDGKIRSCFAMTEPRVASSDATNIESSIVPDGDSYVINGLKWWTSGAMDSRCKVCIFMGKTDTSAPKHRQQSMIVVPMDSPGIKIKRHLTVFGYDDSPHGHAEVEFTNVRVPKSNILLGEGRGFEIAQGRLGPGRIHHCMRSIGIAERALALTLRRIQSRTAFGKTLDKHGKIREDIAASRIDIEQCRLLVLQAAHMMDTVGNRIARQYIAMIKVACPNMALKVIDRGIQAHGGMGVSQDTMLAGAWSGLRTLRLADGPDEVHNVTIARLEIRKAKL